MDELVLEQPDRGLVGGDLYPAALRIILARAFPEAALEARKNGEIVLLPPTFISILELSKYDNSESALEAISQASTEVFYPRVRPMAGGFCQLYEEDVAYDGGELDAPGVRHRLWAFDTGWRYERSEF